MQNIEFKPDLNEVKSALYLTKMLKPYKIKSAVQSVLMIVLAAAFLISAIIYEEYTAGYICAAALLAVAGAAFYLHRQNEKNTVEAAYKSVNQDIRLTVYDEKINVSVPSSGANWDIDKDLFGSVLQDDLIYCAVLSNGKFVIIPKRAVNSDEKKSALDNVFEYFKN